MSPKNRLINYLIAFVILWFLFLCLLHYFSNRPLWLDENFILGNIQQLNVPQLFGILKNSQIFPRFYLVLVKLFSQCFSYNALSLRFFPLLFMILGFTLWIKIYKLESRTNFYLFLLILSFAASHFTTYYAAEAKQYSCDLFSAGIYTLFIYCQRKYIDKEIPVKHLWFFTLFSPFLILFSYISFLMAWMVAYNYLFFIKGNREIKVLFIVYCIISIVFSVLIYLFDIRYSLKVTAMQDYWKDYFINTGSFYEFIKSLTGGLRNLTTRWFAETKLAMRIATVFMPFCWLAIFKSFKSSLAKFRGAILDINMVCGILLTQLFVLSLFKLYPFTGARVTLFMAPFIFYMLVKGIYLTRKIKFIFYPALSGYILFLCGASLYLLLGYLKLYAK